MMVGNSPHLVIEAFLWTKRLKFFQLIIGAGGFSAMRQKVQTHNLLVKIFNKRSIKTQQMCLVTLSAGSPNFVEANLVKLYPQAEFDLKLNKTWLQKLKNASRTMKSSWRIKRLENQPMNLEQYGLVVMNTFNPLNLGQHLKVIQTLPQCK